MCISILSTNFVLRNERYALKTYAGLYVKYPLLLSDFKENLIFETGFRKIRKYQI